MMFCIPFVSGSLVTRVIILNYSSTFEHTSARNVLEFFEGTPTRARRLSTRLHYCK